jgi:hypothetical protein
MFCLHYSPLFPVQDLKNVFEAADIDHSTKIGEHQAIAHGTVFMGSCLQAQLRHSHVAARLQRHSCGSHRVRLRCCCYVAAVVP